LANMFSFSITRKMIMIFASISGDFSFTQAFRFSFFLG
jgi:hypothetical protein